MKPDPSLPAQSPAGDIEAVAAAWMVRRQDGLNAAEEAEFQHWLALDPAHAAALASMAGVWDRLDFLPRRQTEAWRASVAQAVPPHKKPRSARSWGAPRWAGVAMVLALMAGGWMAWGAWQRQPTFEQSYATQRGQLRDVALPDGSTLSMDTATRVDVLLYRQRREVRLREGQVLFSVKGNPRQPFDVVAGPVRVTVVGTRFAVRRTEQGLGEGGVSVVVEEGRVRVSSRQGAQAPASAVELTRGQSITALADGQLGAVVTQGVGGALLSWREGRVSFDGVPLARALAEFERYGDTHLKVRDPAVKALRVTGSFDLRRLDAFTRALPQVLPVTLRGGAGGGTEVVARAAN